MTINKIVDIDLRNKKIRGINEEGSLELQIIKQKRVNDLEIQVLEYIQKVSDWCPEDEVTIDEGVDLYLECKKYPELDGYTEQLEKFVQAVICIGRTDSFISSGRGIVGKVGHYNDADKFMEDYVTGKVAWN